MKGLIFGLYLVGVMAVTLFFIYIFSGILYVFSDASYMGDIAYLPKWIFLFSPLVLLGKTKAVREAMNRFADRL